MEGTRASKLATTAPRVQAITRRHGYGGEGASRADPPNRGPIHAAAGRADEAIRGFTRAKEIDPNFGLAYFHASMAYARAGRPGEAMAVLEQASQLAPGWTESLLGLWCLQNGDRGRAQRILDGLLQKAKTERVSAVPIAWLLAALGNLDLAFEQLGRAYDERDVLMPFIHVYTDFLQPELARDPRFHDLLVKMKLAGVA